MCIPNSRRMLYNNSQLTKTWASLQSINSSCVAPLNSHFSFSVSDESRETVQRMTG